MHIFAPIAPLACVTQAARRLLPPGARVLVAVSGGPDSQALLDHLALLRQHLQISELWAVGVDHQLRPGAADELRLAGDLARFHDVTFYTRRVNVAEGQNRLAAARQARYQALRQLGRELGATHLAVGHTATDQVETLLMNLCRGTSLRGAGAIRAKHRGVVRPLLGLERSAVLAWLAARGIAYAQDPSNSDRRRARARLRADILPGLAQLNPKFERHIAAFCLDAQREDGWLKRRAQRLLHGLLGPKQSLDSARLQALPPIWRRRVLALWLRLVGGRPTRQALDAVLGIVRQRAGAQGAPSVSIAGADICCERGRLWRLASSTRRRSQDGQPAGRDASRTDAAPAKLVVPSCMRLGRHVSLQLSLSEAAVGHAAAADLGARAGIRTQLAMDGAQTVAFDADRLHFELSLRPWQQGDKVRPFGLRGRIKVGDLFTNHKVPRALRQGWPLLMCGDEILWVIGLRRSAHAPVTAQTRRIVTLKVEDHRLGAQDRLSPVRNGFF